MKRPILVSALALSLLAPTVPSTATSAARAKTCDSFVDTYRYDITAGGGETCKHANRIVKSFIRQHKKWKKHTSDGTLAGTWYSNSAFPKWRCSEGSGGGSCSRGKKYAGYQNGPVD